MRHVSALLAVATALVAGCATQPASYHYTQKQIEAGDLDFHRRLRVDEYLNAFPQDWFKVGADQDIAYRVDALTTKPVGVGESTLYQIAVKTRMPTRQESGAPLALSIVIDVSGSMNDDNKIVHTREALRKAMLELKDGDVVSLVTFNQAAQVLASNVVLSNATRPTLVAKVEALDAGGGTDIEDGLVAGYQEMAKFPAGIAKRLLLLTDGRSNVSAVTPEQIAKEAAVGRVEGARISTIGLGRDVNEALLRQVAEAGKGHYYFAENAQTLTTILREGLQTTVIPVARDVTLDIELGASFVFERIHGGGAGDRAGQRSASVTLGELNVNDWRILIVELKRVGSAGGADAMHVSGLYTPLGNQAAAASRPIPRARQNLADSAPSVEKRINPFVLRNAVLYGNAQTLIEAGRLSEQRRYDDALHVVDVQFNNNEVLAAIDDSEMVRKERDNLLKVRSLIAARRPGGVEQTAAVAPPADPHASAGSGLRSLAAAGLRASTTALPGLWSVIAAVLATAIE